MKIVLRILSYLKPYWRRVTCAYLALFTAVGLTTGARYVEHDSANQTVNLNGNSESDSFTVKPSAVAAINVHGNAPTPSRQARRATAARYLTRDA